MCHAVTVFQKMRHYVDNRPSAIYTNRESPAISSPTDKDFFPQMNANIRKLKTSFIMQGRHCPPEVQLIFIEKAGNARPTNLSF
jgi:hypothetical protein